MLRLEKRALPSRAALLIAPVAAVAFTLVVASLLVSWAAAPVGRAYALLLEGGFGSRFAWTETLTRAVPLILTGLAAVAVGISGLFMETHPYPEKAWSDGPNSWPLDRMESLLTTLVALDKAVKLAGFEELS